MTDQPKPLTDDELDVWESGTRARRDEKRPGEYGFLTQSLFLIAEVRRLRVAIRAAAPYFVPSDAWCGGCHRSLIGQDHKSGCPVGVLEEV